MEAFWEPKRHFIFARFSKVSGGYKLFSRASLHKSFTSDAKNYKKSLFCQNRAKNG
jgi:hypothetical protein